MSDRDYSAADLKDFAAYCRTLTDPQLENVIEKERVADRRRCMLVAELERNARNDRYARRTA